MRFPRHEMSRSVLIPYTVWPVWVRHVCQVARRVAISWVFYIIGHFTVVRRGDPRGDFFKAVACAAVITVDNRGSRRG